MSDGNVTVERYDPELGTCVAYSYSVPLRSDSTVLSALLYISDNIDPTFAFRYGCRCTKCGECAVNVDGRPRLACLASAKEGMSISPLKNLPVVRDLIVDRSPIDKKLSEHKLYVVPNIERTLGKLSVPADYMKLIGCLECYGCLSSCPNFSWRNKEFGGPYVFVRLAQLHLDPRDNHDRIAQAISLGIDKCGECTECVCVKGIPIRRAAIETLLGKTTT
jgi:succinate dehydrogenase/fumarate reductase iron-sulfur protein